TRLISVQLANNETGVIQPVAAIGALARKRRIPFHSDAATPRPQAAGTFSVPARRPSSCPPPRMSACAAPLRA
ncbi:MAG: aminotransferase class V-fold PLP-dependent enzyme, partial [Clostridia bacterium]|nr:aminotransferase class V-fold PLP-dependent enzyme [Clostridia bacterium]